MQHFTVECPKFDKLRKELNLTEVMPQLPRVTTKSGWIVCGAARTQEERADLLMRIWKLGMVVVADMDYLVGQSRADDVIEGPPGDAPT